MNFGKTIQELRKQKNVTQEELAAQLGVTAAAVSKWENNYTLPDILMLCALADYFEVTTDALLGRSKKITPAVVVTDGPELAEKISALASEHGFHVQDRFNNYADALAHVLSRDDCKHVFIGLPETLEKDEIDSTPSEVHCVQSIGSSAEDILGGFEMIFRHLISR